MLTFLQADNLQSIPRIRHAFFTRGGGVSQGIYDSLNGGLSSADDPACVHENRRRASAQLDIPPQSFLSCRQTHAAEVVTVRDPWVPDDRPEADAMVTDQRNIALVILTADCVPVLFADDDAGVVGAAHAGWRGALGGILENTLAGMEALGARRATIKAALGPCIWPRSYEVGPAFPAPFLAENPAHENLFRPAPRAEHFLFDLPSYVMGKLRAHGVVSVAAPPADTYQDDARFFSYRRNCHSGIRRAGSLMSAIARL